MCNSDISVHVCVLYPINTNQSFTNKRSTKLEVAYSSQIMNVTEVKLKKKLHAPYLYVSSSKCYFINQIQKKTMARHS